MLLFIPILLINYRKRNKQVLTQSHTSSAPAHHYYPHWAHGDKTAFLLTLKLALALRIHHVWNWTADDKFTPFRSWSCNCHEKTKRIHWAKEGKNRQCPPTMQSFIKRVVCLNVTLNMPSCREVRLWAIWFSTWPWLAQTQKSQYLIEEQANTFKTQCQRQSWFTVQHYLRGRCRKCRKVTFLHQRQDSVLL